MMRGLLRRLGAFLICLLCFCSISAWAQASQAVCEVPKPSIPLPNGNTIRVTPGQPLGHRYATPATIGNFVTGYCLLDMGSEFEAIELAASGKHVTLLLTPNPNYPLVETDLGVVIPIPDITDDIGVGLMLLRGANHTIVAGQEAWVIGTDGELQFDFDGTSVRLFAPRQMQLSYQLAKIAPTRVPGDKIMGFQPGIFDVLWVLDYGMADQRTVARTTVDMSRGNVVSLQAQGCAPRSVRQVLPRVRRAQLAGVGFTFGETSFDLPVVCFGEPSAKLSITPLHPYAMAPGVGLADAGGSMGVGVQLLSGGSGDAPWDFGQQRSLTDLSSMPNNNGSNVYFWTLPFRARYYQVNDSVRAGSLSVIYSLNIHYN